MVAFRSPLPRDPAAKILSLKAEMAAKDETIKVLRDALEGAQRVIKDLKAVDRRSEDMRLALRISNAKVDTLAEIEAENARLRDEVRQYKALAEQAQQQMIRMQQERLAKGLRKGRR